MRSSISGPNAQRNTMLPMMCDQLACMNIDVRIVTRCRPVTMSAGMSAHLVTNASPPVNSSRKTNTLTAMMEAEIFLLHRGVNADGSCDRQPPRDQDDGEGQGQPGIVVECRDAERHTHQPREEEDPPVRRDRPQLERVHGGGEAVEDRPKCDHQREGRDGVERARKNKDAHGKADQSA